MNLTLKVWRQQDSDSKGRIEEYPAENIPIEASYLRDVLSHYQWHTARQRERDYYLSAAHAAL